MEVSAVTREVTIADRVGQYVLLRDKVSAIKDRHKQELAPFNEAMDQLEQIILSHLTANGLDNVKSEQGTAYITETKTASIADGAAFRRHVIGTQAFDLIDFRANKTAVAEFVASNGVPPPGVNYSVTLEIGVRRPTKKEK